MKKSKPPDSHKSTKFLLYETSSTETNFLLKQPFQLENLLFKFQEMELQSEPESHNQAPNSSSRRSLQFHVTSEANSRPHDAHRPPLPSLSDQQAPIFYRTGRNRKSSICQCSFLSNSRTECVYLEYNHKGLR